VPETIGRVCPFARQQCTLAYGCIEFTETVWGADVAHVELRALSCEKRGAMLYADELRTGELHTGEKIVERRAAWRESRLTSLRNQLVAHGSAAGAVAQETGGTLFD
jgi:hypothetical protein